MFNKVFKRCLDTLLFSNFFIAFAAFAQTLLTYRCLHLKVNGFVLLLVTLATFSAYNFGFLFSTSKFLLHTTNQRLAWQIKHRGEIKLLSYACIFICGLVFFFCFNFTSKFIFGLAFLLTLGYHIRFIEKNGRKIDLRALPYLKLFIIASVWTIVTFLIPKIVDSEGFKVVFDLKIILLVIARFSFLAAITLPFDMRDEAQDRLYHLKTIPILFGRKMTLFFCVFLLCVHLFSFLIYSQEGALFFIASTLIFWLSIAILWMPTFKKDAYYYYFYLDGLLVLQGLCLWFV